MLRLRLFFQRRLSRAIILIFRMASRAPGQAIPHVKYMTELRRLLAFSVPTFSSYNPDNAKNRVMPQIWLADEFDERRTRLEASTRPVYISSKIRR